MPVVEGAVFGKNAKIEWDGVEFLGNTTAATLTPDTAIVQEKTLDPGYVLSDADDATWTFVVRGPQVIEGLSEYLTEHAGEKVEVVFTPKRGVGNPTYTFTVTLMAVPIGGERGSFNTFEVSLPVDGEPVKGIAV